MHLLDAGSSSGIYDPTTAATRAYAKHGLAHPQSRLGTSEKGEKRSEETRLSIYVQTSRSIARMTAAKLPKRRARPEVTTSSLWSIQEIIREE